MPLKQTSRRPHNFEAQADEALQAARDMPPGPERAEALKAAGRLRNAIDVYDLIFARPRRRSKRIALANKE